MLSWSAPASAQAVGDAIVNPVTGASETVVTVLGNGGFLTNVENVIFPNPPAVNSTFVDNGVTYTVTGLVSGPYGVTQIQLTSGDPPVVSTLSTVTNVSTELNTVPPGAGGAPGNPGGQITFTPPSGNVNVFADKRVGAQGDGGRNGYGVEICFGIFGCITIGRSGSDGSPGGNGPTVNRTLTVANWGNISSISAGLPGITVSSAGGNGGNGGDSYGALPGNQGGAAGLGGVVILSSSVDVSTSGALSYGIFAQSRGGRGGNGGDGYIFSGGGSGGPASAGGSVQVASSGNIYTQGAGAIGIFAQSLGGAGGSGGDSFGFVGDAGSASVGGHGGTVYVSNSGSIRTLGADAHGISAQSIGGSGGNAGNAGGIVAFGGGPGAGGGEGRTVEVHNSGQLILTEGVGAFGIFAQSIGGGGGSGGYAAGLVAFGGSGSAGGNGGSVLVTNQAGSAIQTLGAGGHGIVAQSIGGGGGFGGTGGGLAALGGSGSAAGSGGAVTVGNDGSITTAGEDARGIVAQSIGGGGGSASGSGGLVSLGGRGGSGGSGGAVSVTSTGDITTAGLGSDAIFAQSIGGGGGSGAASGGVVSIGGAGSAGGSGGAVTVTNSGIIVTGGDRARGIFAQSIGGGGGSGGDSGGLVSVGGSGSVASAGSTVIVTNTGSIATSGAFATAIQAQSIGGGGGDGGTSGGPFSVGGSGGGGGDGGLVTVSNNRFLTTHGDDSHGIFAQSVGGGGGNGGNSASVSGVAGLAIGGSGGSGGVGAAATVAFSDFSVTIAGNTTSVSPVIQTEGDRSNGVLVQSIGGGGGNGGFAVQATGGIAAGSVSIAVGGSGGGGGRGGSVTVTGRATILTDGDNSRGILAQSIGGGGGNGGLAAAVSVGSSTAYSAAVGIGGQGGSGGDGGVVVAMTGGTVSTRGAMSDGLVAQSIGGGGGNGGFAIAAGVGLQSAALGIGGGGGSGGHGASVTVDGTSTITTLGDNASGLVAQSIGGGGGNGGFAGVGSIGVASLAVGVGGTGGNGGSGGSVLVRNVGDISTTGANSSGLVAQSLGGGGGNGGFAIDAAIGVGSVGVGVGGAGGTGSRAGSVTVDTTGSITTLGTNSSGIVAQSIGGGGGNGGFTAGGALAISAFVPAVSAAVNVGGSGGTGGTGGDVSVTSVGGATGTTVSGFPGIFTIATAGAGSSGIVAQSIGGGGGNGGLSASLAGSFNVTGDGAASVAISVGGQGGSGNDSGRVTVDSRNRIITLGDRSYGISAQSIGGGGGNGGFSLAVGVSSQFSGAFSVGGFGGAGGDAAAVSVTNLGAIVTAGSASHAILAQSIGGGGGNGGGSLAGSFSLEGGLSASLGGFGGAGGRGGSVIVSSNVGQAAQIGSAITIATSGASANAIEAQSIGGGGGNGGFSGSFTATANAAASMGLSIGGFGAAGNSAGTVTVTSVDNTATSGSGANGIIAQSVGGGGGNGGFSFAGTVSVPTGNSFSLAASLGGFGGSGGDAGIVTVNSTGAITTSGDHAGGIVAQSIGGGGGNGGLSVAGNFNFASANNTPSVTASVGGFGGSGGTANTVSVTRLGATRTFGNDSIGILAQSIGGGGGNGGMSIAGSIGGPDSKQFSASIGGFGGAGSGAGNVLVNNTGAITTGSITQQQQRIAALGAPVYQTVDVVTGNGSSGIVAQSIGGGGGNGGFAFSGSIAPTGTATTVNVGMTVGGFGGSGGVAGNVDVVNAGLITTYGDNAHGILAQSIGGGGGNGGSAVTGLLAAGNPQTGRAVNVAVSIGGAGGDGNVAGTVFVEQSGGIVTYGAASYGILAQSIGGGGGTGGNANTVSLQLATSCTQSFGLVSSCKEPKKSSVNVEVNVGGAGGAGNDAKAVTVINHGSITTWGDASSGIVAQSIGGGGGSGGKATVGLTGLFPNAQYVDNALTAVTLPFGRSSPATEAGKISVGGFGGTAGDGAVVLVTNEGAIRTAGRMANGIFAQSIGGGGGDGGDGSAGYTGGLGIGGFGGASGNGGAVTVSNGATASIVTSGAGSSAIFAQSVGGGGGNGGAADGIVAIGGYGGATGSGGQVTVANHSLLQTLGIASNGIFAQSVGGGGGNGGNAGSPYTIPLVGISASVGGNASGGGNGGAVLVDNFGAILTDGAASQAIFAQSIGGGGGNGGVAISANIQTTSIPVSAAVSVGGVGGGGGNGGVVTVNNNAGAAIITNGMNSTAIFAQSVGGGGGNGGYAVSASVAQAGSLAVAVGGNGGAGGSGGAVSVNNAGVVAINGKNSIGIMAQSVGGGGGTASSGIGVGIIPVSIGGSNGAVGSGGNVSVVNTGSILIAGDNSVGIFAQSVGGGGGMVRPGGGATSLTLNAGGSGDGGTVTIANTAGIIAVTGDNSIALYSQSVGGGGGAVGLAVDPPGQIGAFLFSGSTGGLGAAQSTTIDQTGSLVATGANSIALVAQSNATGGTGDIIVNILNTSPSQPSIIMGGSGQGAGVFILDGANNTLNNAGIITSVLGADGYAIRATTGNDGVENTGTVTGSVDLAGGINSFRNHVGAVFASGSAINLGAGNTLTNEGLLSPGDFQRVLTTSLTGNLVQTATGAYGVDLDLKSVTADRIDIAGTASVSGTIKVNLFNPTVAAAGAKPGTHDITILTTTGGLTRSGLALEAPGTVVSQYSLLYPNANDVVLRHMIDFAPAGLNPSQLAVANAINRIQGAQSSPGFVPLATALFFQPTVASLSKALESLSGSGTSGTQQSSFAASDAFLSTMGRQVDLWLSSAVQSGAGNTPFANTASTVMAGYSGLGGPGSRAEPARPASRILETDLSKWHLWASAFAGRSAVAGNVAVGSVAASTSGGGLSAGVDVRLSPNALVGVSVGASMYNFGVPLRETTGTAEAAHFSIYGAIRGDNAYLSSTLAYGLIDNTTKRHAAVAGNVVQQAGGAVLIPGLSEYLNGQFLSQSVSTQLEAGYRIPLGLAEVTPFAAMQFTSLRSHAYDETTFGPSQIGLSFATRTTTSLPMLLGVKLRSEFQLNGDMRLATWAQAAWKHEFRRDRSTEASFLTAPGFGFTVDGARPDADALRTSLGAQLKLDANTSLFAGFDGDFSRTGHSYGGTAGLQIRW